MIPDCETRVNALGVMSGTSLDGLDLCLAEFSFNEVWQFSIIKAQTFTYSQREIGLLASAYSATAPKLAELHSWFGQFVGDTIVKFCRGNNFKVDVIGSHGHTVFHNPGQGYTTQIGSGSHIAAVTKIPCVCDFRMADVARGGQGAPLVPIGDELLFSEYDFCLNIGGFANVSYASNGARVAFDACPANIAINKLANLLGLPFDCNGDIGRTGIVNETLLHQLNSLGFYQVVGAKSLGREWFEGCFWPLFSQANLPVEDKLRTAYEHIACKIAECFEIKGKGKALVTGGGAHNRFLMELIRAKCSVDVEVPSSMLVDFKEALVFGLLAVLYLRRIPSCLASVTGAHTDSIGGCLYY